jgi:hypothetical protein
MMSEVVGMTGVGKPVQGRNRKVRMAAMASVLDER